MVIWNTGSDNPWPSQPFCITSGDLLLVVRCRHDFGLFRLKHGLSYPGLPSALNGDLQIALKAIQSSQVDIDHVGDCRNGLQWLDEQLTQAISISVSSLPRGNEWVDKIFFIYHELEQRHEELIDEHQRSNASSSQQLFLSINQGKNSENVSDDPVFCALSVMCEGHGALKPAPLNQKGADPRLHLDQLLNGTDLYAREVEIDPVDLQQDCGDLIGFLSSETDDLADVVVLRAMASGYHAWVPLQMHQFLPLEQCQGLLNRLQPRMLSISPTLRSKDLTTLGLLRFAYGQPRHTTTFVISGLLLGVLIGFLFAVGREVGAARWILGMGVTGLFAGTCLGLLTGGFRLGVGVMLLSTLLSLLTPTFNTVITNQAIPDRDLDLLVQSSLILVAAGLTRVCFEWVQFQAVQRTQQRGASRFQLAGMHRLLRLPAEFFRHRNVGDLQLRLDSLGELREEIQKLLEGGLIRLVLTSIYILFMLRISVKLTALAIVVAILILLPTALIGLQSRPLQRHQEEAEAQAQSRNLELLSAVSKLRIAGAETAAARWWVQKFRTIVELEHAIDAKEATSALLQAIVPNLGTLLIYIVVTKLIAEASFNSSLNAPNVGQLLGFFSAFGTFIGSASGFAGLLIGAFDMPVIYERARPILDTEPESIDQKDEAGVLRGEIQLERVSYRYAPKLPLALDGVSFLAKAGEHLAIVGPSGSGKSTLVRLLLGFTSPEDGEIRFDGKPLNGLRLRSLRRQIGTVLQTDTFFSGTLMEAISGGRVIDEEHAWHAAEMVGLADEIRAMPMGLQTLLPDGGGTLSGGQRQRVVIARALIQQPRILILDEATSALDNRTQAILTSSLASLAITRIVIAHRLSTVRRANRILVLDRGQVIEQGSYETLIKNKGLFFRMMERQL